MTTTFPIGLYFEPLTFEDVMAIVEREKPAGVIVQFGGSNSVEARGSTIASGVPILGTSPDAIDRAEDRERFNTGCEAWAEATGGHARARPG